MDTTCESCLFFDVTHSTHLTGDMGVCRRRSPIASATWPSVAHHDWCGEFKYYERCGNCGHYEIHDGGRGEIADACTHPGCVCGYDSRDERSDKERLKEMVKRAEETLAMAEADQIVERGKSDIKPILNGVESPVKRCGCSAGGWCPDHTPAIFKVGNCNVMEMDFRKVASNKVKVCRCEKFRHPHDPAEHNPDPDYGF